ncbi:TetR/AcrR family transcriptional regulator [Paraburkholderia sp. SIMBA_049]
MTTSTSSTDPARATEPKRERGRLRVAAIMTAGVEVFTEKGYDAATMTEIAARSGTAIGSLYRFFPTKEALADALLLQYAQQVKNGLTELKQQVPGMTLERVADAFVDMMLLLRSQRSFAIALMDARGGSADERKRFRKVMRGGVADILCEVIPALPAAKAKVMSVVLIHMLKAVVGIADEESSVRAALLAEMRQLVRMYLVSASQQSGE